MAVDLGKLNNEQREAVVHQDGPLLIVAGAGTGKTTVITDRVVYLIEQGLAKPEEILAVTFTEKAALEMEERVDRALPFGYFDLWISTFHAFSERILKDNGLNIGLPTDFKLLTQTSAWILMRQNLDKFDLKYYKPLGNPNKFLNSLISHFSKCKDQMIYPKDYLEYSENNLEDEERIKELANCYHIYQQLLLENNYLDFGDLINYCLQLFQKRPSILEKYQAKFKYILVDEFQDTNKAQYELIKLLSQPKNNLTVTADDDQAIYKWRGASVGNIKQFKKDFPGAKEICLIKNYRSSQNILDLAYNFIQANNPNRLEYISKIDKKLQAQKTESGTISFLNFTTAEEEAKGVAKKIAELLQADITARLNDFAVLVRANNSAGVFAKILEKNGIPCQFLASQGLYQKPIVLNIISYLKLLDNYHESLALYRVLSLPIFDIDNNDIMRITQESHKNSQSVYETLTKLSVIKGISQETLKKVIFILSLINRHTEMAKTRSVGEVFVSFLNDSGYLKYLAQNDKLLEIDLLTQFYKKIKEFEDSSIDPLLKTFLSQLNWELEGGEQGKLDFDPEQGPESIKIMTIHSAKGLEFKYVFVVGLVDKRFPSIERKDPIEIPDGLAKEDLPEGDIHLQEERRLFYVGLTRAKNGIFLTSAQNYGGKTLKKPSIFLIELGFATPKPDRAKAGSEQILDGVAKEPPALKIENWPMPDHFSFTQLAAFQKCPYQYKLAHILKVPVKGKPSFSFGKTIHNTLNDFLRSYFEKPNQSQDNLFGFGNYSARSVVSLEDLMGLYEKNWIGEWYESKSQKDDYKKLGQKILKNFYDDFIKNPPKILFIDNEIALELPFNLKVGDYILKGKIDRVEETSEGIKIVDYKTGKKKEKLEKDDKIQLLIYQIALEEIWKINPTQLVYHYIEDGEKVSYLGTDVEKEKLKEHIIDVILQITKSDFKATPGFHCQFCDFYNICQFASGGGEE
ncbi:MAG: UvrD-helicase domain-containing protein [bacterium]|nr:UvrD-helicase domain-containing protein [bacterium]